MYPEHFSAWGPYPALDKGKIVIVRYVRDSRRGTSMVGNAGNPQREHVLAARSLWRRVTAVSI